MASVGGGLASKATGGSFSDGARTAAFGYLFNEMLTLKNGQRVKTNGRAYYGDRSMSDNMAFSPEMSKQAWSTIEHGVEACGLFYAPCRGASFAMGTAGAATSLVEKDYLGVGAFVAGEVVGGKVESSLNAVKALSGKPLYAGGFTAGMGHAYDTATSKGVEAFSDVIEP